MTRRRNPDTDSMTMFDDPILEGAFDPLPTEATTSAIAYLVRAGAADLLDMLGLAVPKTGVVA